MQTKLGNDFMASSGIFQQYGKYAGISIEFCWMYEGEWVNIIATM